MHLLRASEPLPAAMEDAYRDADKLVMEIDMADLDPLAAQQLTMELGMQPTGKTLTEDIGPETTEKLDAYTKQLGIPTGMLNQFKPWLAAITLTQLQMLKMGLDPQSGIEQRFLAKATSDHKEIQGLETISEQLHLLADLPTPLQAQFLLQTLTEAQEADQEIEALLGAWRSGDAVALDKYSARGMKEFPKLYGPLTVERNRRWIGRLEEMLNADKNYLVIVGVLHLVGNDGVVDLLQHQGYKIQQH